MKSRFTVSPLGRRNTFIKLIMVAVTALSLLSPSLAYEEPVDFSSLTPANAAIRSLLVPGWGQLFNGEKAKGYIIIAAEGVLLTGSLILYRVAENTYEKYEETGDPDSELYDRYSREITATNVLLIGAGILWGYAVIDAYLNSPRVRRGVSLRVTEKELKLVYRF